MCQTTYPQLQYYCLKGHGSGGVTTPKGFKAAGMYAGLRAVGEKPDLALVVYDVDALPAGTFTTNVVVAAPVLYCKEALKNSATARAILINDGQANAATGDAGYQDAIECCHALSKLLQLSPAQVLIESTGVIGKRIKKEGLLKSLPALVHQLSPTVEGQSSTPLPSILPQTTVHALQHLLVCLKTIDGFLLEIDFAK